MIYIIYIISIAKTSKSKYSRFSVTPTEKNAQIKPLKPLSNSQNHPTYKLFLALMYNQLKTNAHLDGGYNNVHLSSSNFMKLEVILRIIYI
jgi:hypothetical protein